MMLAEISAKSFTAKKNLAAGGTSNVKESFPSKSPIPWTKATSVRRPFIPMLVNDIFMVEEKSLTKGPYSTKTSSTT